MHIYAAWLLKHVASTRTISEGKRSLFMSERCTLTRILHSLGRGFLVPTRSFTSPTPTKLLLGVVRLKVHWKMHKDSSRTRPKRSSPWVITNIGCCVITGLPKPPSNAFRMLPGSSDVLNGLGAVTRREGHW